MHKLLKGLSTVLLLTLLVSALTVAPGSAAEEARVEVWSGRGAYVSVTNVVKAEPDARLYVAVAPVTITFHGQGLTHESIDYNSGAERFGNSINFTGTSEEVKFDVKRYSNMGETEVRDELFQQPADFPLYVTGNYATVTKPGFYLVIAAPEAADPTMFALHVAPPPTEASAGATAEALSAVPTASKVLVDGASISFAAYQINGNNYFKLRDLAQVLNGTKKQFEVTWDAEKNAINLVTGREYTPVGGELGLPVNPWTQAAVPTASQLYLNGEAVQFAAYNIGGNNYFKLRDIAKALDFGVTWNAAENSIDINSRGRYSE